MHIFLKKSWLTILFLSFAGSVFAQKKYTLSGIVKDKKNGEALIGATVRVNMVGAGGTVTNTYGFLSLTLPEGNYPIRVSFIGYTTYSTTINLSTDIKQEFALETAGELKEVVVSDKRNDENVTRAQMGVEKLDMKQASKIPVLFGEKDILKTIQLLPGVLPAGDGSSGFYVRGGGLDQNLILLDGAPVYNPSHLLGFFSVFNSDAIKDVTLYKGNMPADMGGRLSSALDIKMNDGDNRNYHVAGGIGLISSKLEVDGPILKDQGSFIISARRTYADVFLKLSSDTAINKSSLYFYDLNLKANYKLGEKDRLFLSGYLGRDVLGLASTFGINWGNTTGTLRWNHLISNKLFSNTSLIYSNYDYVIKITANSNDIKITSRIRDYNIKQEFEYYPNPNNSIKFGFNSIYHTITPGSISSSSASSKITDTQNLKHAWENAIYFTNEWHAGGRLNITYGIRGSAFAYLTKGKYYSYKTQNVNGNMQEVATDSSYSGAERVVKTYFNPEPRLALSFLLNETSSIKAAYTRTSQYLHLLTNSTTTNPTDKWVPTSNNILPELADQVSGGYFKNLDNNKYEFCAEVYYKYMQHQIDYKNGADLQTSTIDVESQLLFGIGRAYGLELNFKKKAGKFTGWVSYTLAKSERKTDGVNNGNWYNATQDRTHDISIVAIYDISRRWSVSATWVYYTGNAATFPSGKYSLDAENSTVFYYTSRNGYRYPPYHRLDLGATFLRKKTAHFESSWNFSVYNAYARENPYTITFQQDPNNPSVTQAVQTSLFKLVPSVAYNFKF